MAARYLRANIHTFPLFQCQAINGWRAPRPNGKNLLNDIVEVKRKFFDWIAIFNRDYDVFFNG
jgi:hypothetical protein